MIWFIIYLIGCIVMFFIAKAYKEKDAKDSYDEYKIVLTNGQWFVATIFRCIFSWLMVFMIILYISSEFIKKQLDKVNIVKSLKTWWKSPIYYEKDYI